MATLFTETFSGTAGTNLTDHGPYAKHSASSNTGDIKLRSGGGAEYTSTTPAGVYYRTDLTGLTTINSEAILTLSGTQAASNGYFALFNRLDSASTKWLSIIFNGYFGLQVKSAMYGTEFLGAGAGGYLFNNMLNEAFGAGTYKVKFQSIGLLHRLFINGQEYIRCRDNATSGIASGRVGIGFGDHWNTGYLSQWKVEDACEEDQFVCAQDSFGQGDWYDDTNTLVTIGRDSVWPALVFQRLKLRGYTGDFGNASVSGRTIAEENTDWDTLKSTTAIVPGVNKAGTNYGWGNGQVYRSGAARNVALLALGTNDLAGGATAATVKSRLDTLVANYNGKGYTTILGTLVHCDEASAYIPAGFNDKVDEVNDHILAGNPGQTRTVDLTGDSRVFEPGAADRSTSDGVHWRPETHEFVADLWEPEVAAALGISSSVGGPGFGIGTGIIGG